MFEIVKTLFRTWIEYDTDQTICKAFYNQIKTQTIENNMWENTWVVFKGTDLDISTMLLFRPIESFWTGEILNVDLQL